MSNRLGDSHSVKLRFPEFKQSGNWKTDPLGELATEISEKVGSKNFKLMSITSGVGLVSQIEKFGREIAGESVKNYLVIRRNDFAYNKSSTKLFPEGEIAILENEESGAVPNSIFSCFRFDENVINPKFIKYPFLANVHGRWLRNFLSVGARANGALQVNQKDLFALPISYPSLAEQQRIADCLSSLDDLITAQSSQLEALKAHKKGLLQQLFPAEGETVPRLRFPEFQDSENWEEKKLDEIARRGSGHTPSKSKPENYNGGIKWISLADSKRLDNGLITETVTEISMEGIKTSSAVLHPAGTVLISRDAGIGKSAVMVEAMAVSQHFIVWTCSYGYLDNWFLYHFLQKSKPMFENAAIGSTIKTIGLQFFKDLTLAIPSFAEQQKIASCLSTVDDRITAQTKRIEQLKLHKKGLMQGLFPLINKD